MYIHLHKFKACFVFHAHSLIHRHRDTLLYLYMHTHTYVCAQLRTYTFVQAHARTHMHEHARTQTHTNVHKRTQTQTHTLMDTGFIWCAPICGSHTGSSIFISIFFSPFLSFLHTLTRSWQRPRYYFFIGVHLCLYNLCLLYIRAIRTLIVTQRYQMVSGSLALLFLRFPLLLIFSYLCSSRAAAPVGDEVL